MTCINALGRPFQTATQCIQGVAKEHNNFISGFDEFLSRKRFAQTKGANQRRVCIDVAIFIRNDRANVFSIDLVQKQFVGLQHLSVRVAFPRFVDSSIGLFAVLTDLVQRHVHAVKDLERTFQAQLGQQLHHHAITHANSQHWDGTNTSLTWTKHVRVAAERIIQCTTILKISAFKTECLFTRNQERLISCLNQRRNAPEIGNDLVQLSLAQEVTTTPGRIVGFLLSHLLVNALLVHRFQENRLHLRSITKSSY